MKRVVLISGKQGSGKSTLSDSLLIYLIKKGLNPRGAKFAIPLYEMHDAVREVLIKYGVAVPDIDADLLQLLGTDWGRMKYGEDVWVKCLKNKAQSLFEKGIDVLIVDDCRFPNEVACFDGEEDVRVLKVRLECPEEIRKERRGTKWRANTKHPSETGLDDYGDWDLVINTEKPFDTGFVAEMIELLWEIRK